MQQDSTEADTRRRPGFFVRLVRALAWLCVAIGALALAGLAVVYAPCFVGTPGTCLSGILLLFGGAFSIMVGGAGWLVLALTRSRLDPIVNERSHE